MYGMASVGDVDDDDDDEDDDNDHGDDDDDCIMIDMHTCWHTCCSYFDAARIS